MNLPLSALLYQITDLCDYELFHADSASSFEGVQLFDISSPQLPEPGFLYYITDETLLEYCRKYHNPISLQHSPFLCYCNGDYQNVKESCGDLPVIFLVSKKKTAFSVVFNRVLNTFHNFEYWDKTLHLSLLHGTSIQQLLDITKPLLSHPMLILNANLSVIGRVHKSSEPDPYMEDLLHSGYLTPEKLKNYRTLGILSTNFQSEPLTISRYFHPDGQQFYSMCYHLMANGRIHGYALVFHCISHPSNSYQYLMDMVIDNLSLYYKQERYSVSASSERYEQFLTTLLADPSLSRRQIKSHLSYIPSLNLNGYFMLAKLIFPDDAKVSFSFVSWNLINTFPELKPFVYENSLYILKTAAEPKDVLHDFLSPEKLDSFVNCFSGIPFHCCVSQAFFKLTDLSLAARQCDLSNTNFNEADHEFFSHYRDAKLSLLLQKVGDVHTMQMMESPYYHVLKDYDLEYGGGLCEIFAQYLLNSRSITQTANATFMHRNTVLNKVKKATLVMGTELEDYALGLFFILNYLNDMEREDTKHAHLV